jgi:quercetin dioxygenase-like cupin family protein
MRLVLLLSLLAAPLAAQEGPVSTPVLDTTQTAAGQPIDPPDDDAQVIVTRLAIPPGAELPVHKHPFPRMAYVLAGQLVVTDVESGSETTYAQGDFIVEMTGTWHFGRNDGTGPLELLVIDTVPEGTSNTVLREE